MKTALAAIGSISLRASVEPGRLDLAMVSEMPMTGSRSIGLTLVHEDLEAFAAAVTLLLHDAGVVPTTAAFARKEAAELKKKCSYLGAEMRRQGEAWSATRAANHERHMRTLAERDGARAEIARLRGVIQNNAASASEFLNEVLDVKYLGVIERGDCRDLRIICQVAERPENGGA